MDNHKGQEQTALHATIQRIVNNPCGLVDGWDCKSYVMVDTIRKVDNDR